MTDKPLDAAALAELLRRAGLELTAAELEQLHADIAPSLAALARLRRRVRERLVADSEPQHLFAPGRLGDGG
jgi:hypothetical protein